MTSPGGEMVNGEVTSVGEIAGGESSWWRDDWIPVFVLLQWNLRRIAETVRIIEIIIQQIVTMPIYGKEALNICHPYMTDTLRYT